VPLLRIGDADCGIGFTLSKAMDHGGARPARALTALHCRPLRSGSGC
jgi:hypothetical protein